MYFRQRENELILHFVILFGKFADLCDTCWACTTEYSSTVNRWRRVCWTDWQNQTLEKTCGKMLDRYSCDNVDGDRPPASSIDRFTSEQHAAYHGTAAGRPNAERHTQIF